LAGGGAHEKREWLAGPIHWNSIAGEVSSIRGKKNLGKKV